ncbi:MAG TPA: FMN-binding protein [Chloroflexota bacterium]|jgi:uncharacterized protein with FMN-binding domain|nr:FMN-binding protein [Chloroflexota bacterium]
MARRMSHRLVALSTAAIAAVFSVGYVHTLSEAGQLVGADTVTASTGSLAATAPAVAVATPTTISFPAGSAFTLPARTARRAEGGGRGDRRNGAAPTFLRPAPTATSAPPATTGAVQLTRYRDGSYTGMGENRHGDVQVTVVVSGGRIASAAISDCGMQYPCSRIAMLPGQVLARQSTNVDLVSGATMSSTAYQDAVQQALTKATV